jgi:hypothetical protein
MARKGKITEIFSKASYTDNPDLYSIGYIDLGKIKEIRFQEFLKLSENFEVIPASRIAYIKKENNIIYSKIKNRKESDQF